MRSVTRLSQLLASSLALFAVLAQAQTAAYPSHPIRFVVPYPPGGPTDLMARLLQPEMQSRLGQPVLVENKGGAGGNLGSAEVAKQAPADVVEQERNRLAGFERDCAALDENLGRLRRLAPP